MKRGCRCRELVIDVGSSIPGNFAALLGIGAHWLGVRGKSLESLDGHCFYYTTTEAALLFSILEERPPSRPVETGNA